MNKKLKSKLGITLIALVITIIILLILAGVTISSIVNGGLIGRASEAEFKTRMAEYRDGLNYGEQIDICIKKIDYDRKKVKLIIM